MKAPRTYQAIRNRVTYEKPPLPVLGAAGFAFTDQVFGSQLVRVTDGQTRPGSPGRSYRVPSNARLSAWNADATLFYVVSNDGTVIPYTFHAGSMSASRLRSSCSDDGGLTLKFYVEPQFSVGNPRLLYGADSFSNNLTISAYDFTTGLYTKVVDLAALVDGLDGTYVGGVMTGGPTSEKLLVFFGGSGQDQHHYALWTPIGNLKARKLLDTLASTINGVALATPLNFHLHSITADRSGRFALLYPTVGDIARGVAQVWVWDTTRGTVQPITAAPFGHDTAGYGTWVNHDCCTSGPWDAGQWQYRDLTAPNQPRDLITPVLLPKAVYLDDHSTWNNAQPGVAVPIVSSTYRYGDNQAPWRAWDDELVAIETKAGGGRVWRFAHHRSDPRRDSDPLATDFWATPIANVSPNGRWVIFTSNWEKTLGVNADDGTARQDVFLVALT